MKSLGIIGFGQFGQLAAQHLKSHFEVHVSDVSEDVRQGADVAGISFGAIADAAACDIVLVAVPVRAMRAVFTAIGTDLKPGALVIDVGSVKMMPSQWMLEILPTHVDIVATHPLFGPQSARNGLEGLRLVVCPIRGARADCVAAFGQSLGLIVNVTTPEEHDREMAYVQALTHLIGRSLVNLDIPDEQMKTTSYQHLLDLCCLVGGDSFELFTAIQTQNPFAAEIVEAFVAEARDLLDKLNRDQD